LEPSFTEELLTHVYCYSVYKLADNIKINVPLPEKMATMIFLLLFASPFLNIVRLHSHTCAVCKPWG